MIYCKKCGTALPDDAVFCVKCGTKVDRSADAQSGDADKTQPLLTVSADAAQDPGKKPDLAAEAAKLSKKSSAKAPISAPPVPGDIDDNKSSSAFIAVVLGFVVFCGAMLGAYYIVGPGASGSTATTKVTHDPNAKPVKTAAQEKAEQAEAAEKERAHQEAIKPPVTLDRVIVKPNVIGEPLVSLVMTNHSGKTIDAYKVQISVYNNYGEQLKEFGVGNDHFNGISQDALGDGQSSSSSRSWTLHGFDTGRKFIVRLMSIHYSDGTEWTTEQDQQVTAEGKL